MFRTMIPWTTKFPTLPTWEREFPALMERWFGEDVLPTNGEDFFTPRANVAETEKGMEITVELPGVKPEDVRVEVHGGELWITGEKKEEKEEKGKTFHRVERRYGEFRRVIPLPTTVDKEKITAEYKEGVLKVEVVKTEEAKPKRIEVKA